MYVSTLQAAKKNSASTKSPARSHGRRNTSKAAKPKAKEEAVTLKKVDFLSAIVKDTGLSKSQSGQALHSILSILTGEIPAGQKSISFSGFGKFDGKLNKMFQGIDNFDSKIDTLSQNETEVKNHLVEAKDELSVLESLQGEANKRKILEQALDLTDIDSFQYYRSPSPSSYSTSHDTEQLAKKAIRYFMLGYGFNFPSEYSLTECGDEGGSEAFRQTFKAQIKRLIQREPRMIREEDDGSFSIHYC